MESYSHHHHQMQMAIMKAESTNMTDCEQNTSVFIVHQNHRTSSLTKTNTTKAIASSSSIRTMDHSVTSSTTAYAPPVTSGSTDKAISTVSSSIQSTNKHSHSRHSLATQSSSSSTTSSVDIKKSRDHHHNNNPSMSSSTTTKKVRIGQQDIRLHPNPKWFSYQPSNNIIPSESLAQGHSQSSGVSRETRNVDKFNPIQSRQQQQQDSTHSSYHHEAIQKSLKGTRDYIVSSNRFILKKIATDSTSSSPPDRLSPSSFTFHSYNAPGLRSSKSGSPDRLDHMCSSIVIDPIATNSDTVASNNLDSNTSPRGNIIETKTHKDIEEMVCGPDKSAKIQKKQAREELERKKRNLERIAIRNLIA